MNYVLPLGQGTNVHTHTKYIRIQETKANLQSPFGYTTGHVNPYPANVENRVSS